MEASHTFRSFFSFKGTRIFFVFAMMKAGIQVTIDEQVILLKPKADLQNDSVIWSSDKEVPYMNELTRAIERYRL